VPPVPPVVAVGEAVVLVGVRPPCAPAAVAVGVAAVAVLVDVAVAVLLEPPDVPPDPPDDLLPEELDDELFRVLDLDEDSFEPLLSEDSELLSLGFGVLVASLVGSFVGCLVGSLVAFGSLVEEERVLPELLLFESLLFESSFFESSLLELPELEPRVLLDCRVFELLLGAGVAFGSASAASKLGADSGANATPAASTMASARCKACRA
jgi:hypothetical protein